MKVAKPKTAYPPNCLTCPALSLDKATLLLKCERSGQTSKVPNMKTEGCHG